jgi:hypothetical protein
MTLMSMKLIKITSENMTLMNRMTLIMMTISRMTFLLIMLSRKAHCRIPIIPIHNYTRQNKGKITLCIVAFSK